MSRDLHKKGVVALITVFAYLWAAYFMEMYMQSIQES